MTTLWKPQTAPTQERLTEWKTTAAPSNKVEAIPEKDVSTLEKLTDADKLAMGLEKGTVHRTKQMTVAIFEHRRPLLVHLYFNPQTAATRAINLGADKEVGKVIASVLEKRYPPFAFKIESYSPRYSGFDLQAFCLIIRESPFTAGARYREVTMLELSDALEKMEQEYEL